MGTAHLSTTAESSEDEDNDKHSFETVGKKGAARAMAVARLVQRTRLYHGYG